MTIEPNLLLIGLQAIPFFVTVLGLYFIIFKPMLAYLDEREAAMTQGRDEARQLEERIEEQLTEYDGKLAAAKRQVAELRKRRRTEAQEAFADRVAIAREDAEAEIGRALTKVRAERQRAADEMKGMAEDLADNIAGCVLGRPVALPPADGARG